MTNKFFFGNRTAGTVGIACVKSKSSYLYEVFNNNQKYRHTNKEAKEERCKREIVIDK